MGSRSTTVRVVATGQRFRSTKRLVKAIPKDSSSASGPVAMAVPRTTRYFLNSWETRGGILVRSSFLSPLRSRRRTAQSQELGVVEPAARTAQNRGRGAARSWGVEASRDRRPAGSFSRRHGLAVGSGCRVKFGRRASRWRQRGRHLHQPVQREAPEIGIADAEEIRRSEPGETRRLVSSETTVVQHRDDSRSKDSLGLLQVRLGVAEVPEDVPAAVNEFGFSVGDHRHGHHAAVRRTRSPSSSSVVLE